MKNSEEREPKSNSRKGRIRNKMWVLRNIVLLSGLGISFAIGVQAQSHLQDQVEHLQVSQSVQDVKIASLETRVMEDERRLSDIEAIKPDVRIGRIEATLESNNKLLIGLLISVGTLILAEILSWISGWKRKISLPGDLE